MSNLYDVYKEEAFRILIDAPALMLGIKTYINNLKATFAPAVRVRDCNENHYRDHETFAVTIAGYADVLEDEDWSKRPVQTHWMEQARRRNQNKWLSRKLKDHGKEIGAKYTQVSTCNGSVYFSYHLVVPQQSYLVDS